jgi:hypothetical protein
MTLSDYLLAEVPLLSTEANHHQLMSQAYSTVCAPSSALRLQLTMPATPRDTKAKRTPFKPKEPLPVAERLPKLYRGLVDQVEGSHFAGAIKTCRKSMSTSIPDMRLRLMISPFARSRVILGISDSSIPTSTYGRLHLGSSRP